MNEPDALDAIPTSLSAAKDEYEQVKADLTEAQTIIQQTQQFLETKTRRGIFLEGLIAGWGQTNRATRRAK